MITAKLQFYFELSYISADKKRNSEETRRNKKILEDSFQLFNFSTFQSFNYLPISPQFRKLILSEENELGGQHSHKRGCLAKNGIKTLYGKSESV